ncbi:MAG: cysteine desulfurase [Clostridia bacterium]|nr:cysteine desulfurase [Clostridia bacterium]
MKKIYLDNAATTPLRVEVRDKMAACDLEAFGNASAVYADGRAARKALEQARRIVAECLKVRAEEVYFTSGGSESDNWALKGIAFQHFKERGHLIVSSIEHPAIRNTCHFLAEIGFSVTELPVDALGRVRPDDVRQAIRSDTRLISVMTANNEVGTVEPIEEIGRIAREQGVPFHTDAVQAGGVLPLEDWSGVIDLLSLSAHKFHGPKGIGVLMIRNGTRIKPWLHGGEQEQGLRASTENVVGAVGLAEALRLSIADRDQAVSKVKALRDRLIDQVLHNIPDVKLNGSRDDRLPGNAHFSFLGVRSSELIPRLDLEGLEASAGSACTAGTYEPSYVLQAMQVPPEWQEGRLRLTLSDRNTEDEVNQAAEILSHTIHALRKS